LLTGQLQAFFLSPPGIEKDGHEQHQHACDGQTRQHHEPELLRRPGIRRLQIAGDRDVVSESSRGKA